MGVAGPPTVAVVICAYTEARWELIVNAVGSIEGQTRPAAQLILVVDHNDTLLERARAAWPAHLVVANGHQRGLSGARNTGLDHASGMGVVAFLDDDAVAHATWLERLTAPFSHPEVAGVGGSVRPAWETGQPGWFPSEFLWVVGCSHSGMPDSFSSVRNPIGAGMAFRRDLIVEVGGFNEQVGRVGTLPVGCEETELSIRVRKLGWDIVYDPAAVVDHVVPVERGRLSYFVRRCVAEGRSKAMVAQLSGTSGALASERTYVRRMLPLGVVYGVRQAVLGPRRPDGLARAAAIPVGLVMTTFGYLSSTVASISVSASVSKFRATGSWRVVRSPTESGPR